MMPPDALRAVVVGHRFENLDFEREILAPVAQVFEVHPQNDDELIGAIADADAILKQNCELGPTIIAALARCRVIVTYGVGVDTIDVDAATARGILVCNVPDYCIEEVATHTLALLLTFERKIPQMMARLRGGHWEGPEAYTIHRLTGRTLGLLGFGRIGQRVGALGAAFGLRVLAHDPYLTSEQVRRAGAEWIPLDDLWTRSDYLSVHCPLTRETKEMIGATELARMREDAVLINTSRGRVVHEEALIEALKAGRLRGAALDVFQDEPIAPTHPLLALDNVIVTPHLAWYSDRAQSDVRLRAAEEVRRVLLGSPPKHPVNHIGGSQP